MFMRIITIIFYLLLTGQMAIAQQVSDYLMPTPQHIEIHQGHLNHHHKIAFNDDKFIRAIENIAPFNIKGVLQIYSSPLLNNSFKLAIDSSLQRNQEYRLTIDSGTITITGNNDAALFYGKQTLQQIIKYSKDTGRPIPCLTISDWPDFERRGYMLDISRDKVPTMETLYRIIDFLAMWKVNEFQLYTEHTFAYSNHSKVWENASPITAEEIQKLDIYCKARFIDLVPNQNSFGHMENWLKHDEYLHLAECPTDCNTAWGKRNRHSLNPVNPQSFELMQELYNELLPNFSSTYFNIGCDETVELGHGLSKAACDQKGKGTVYLDFVKKLNAEVNAQGKKAQFWGDIILNYPELITSVPQNMTAMVWGYESNFPFEKQLPKFKESGLDFYVCPGTSTWRSLIGRNKDAFANLQRAAHFGKEYGAKGYLNTNWGDWGHWQPLSVCYPPMAVGAAYAWNSSVDPSHNLSTALNKFVFDDATGKLSQALLKLGNAYLKCQIPEGNANAFHLMLRRYDWSMKGHYQTKLLKKDNLIQAEVEINAALKLLQASAPKCEDATIIVEEIKHAANMALHGIHLGIARLEAENFATENINPAKRVLLSKELQEIIKMHGELWTVRNREGGLQQSVLKLNDLLDYYK